MCAEGKAGPGNTPVRKLFADERFCKAVLEFLSTTSVGIVKEGVICRESRG